MSVRWIFPSILALLAACSAAPVPDFTWYRLPRAQPLEVASAPLFDEPIVVGAFNADGLYGDQPLIYALDAGAQQLRQYHYQLWTDPPARMLQRRLIAELRDAKAATVVTDGLAASTPAIRIAGTILRFDRVPVADTGFKVVVALKMHVDRTDGARLLDRYYQTETATRSGTLAASVDAYGVALDTLFAQFYADLRKGGGDAHAR